MNSRIPDILRKIIKSKASEIQECVKSLPVFKKKIRELAILAPPLDFRRAIAGKTLSVIAEIKKASPSAGIISSDFNPEETALAYQKAGANAISILTEKKYFLGDTSIIIDLRNKISVPILRKDFIVVPEQIYETRAIGADTFLLIVAALDRRKLHDFILIGRELGMEPLVEIHDEKELETAIESDAQIIGVNNRDLHNFHVDLNVSLNLIRKIPRNTVKVAESGIKTLDDACKIYNAGFDAILVGETLMKAGIGNCGRMIKRFKGSKKRLGADSIKLA